MHLNENVAILAGYSEWGKETIVEEDRGSADLLAPFSEDIWYGDQDAIRPIKLNRVEEAKKDDEDGYSAQSRLPRLLSVEVVHHIPGNRTHFRASEGILLAGREGCERDGNECGWPYEPLDLMPVWSEVEGGEEKK